MSSENIGRVVALLTLALIRCGSPDPRAQTPAPPAERPVTAMASPVESFAVSTEEQVLSCEELTAQRDGALAAGRYARATALLRRNIDRSCPDRPVEVSRSYAELLAEFGDPEEARAEAARLATQGEQVAASAIEALVQSFGPKEPPDAAGREAVFREYERAMAALSAKDFKRALNGFERVRASWRPFPEATIGAARALIALGRAREGQRLLDRAGGEAGVDLPSPPTGYTLEAASPTGRVLVGGGVVDVATSEILATLGGNGGAAVSLDVAIEDGACSFDASGLRIACLQSFRDRAADVDERRLVVYHALSGRLLSSHRLPEPTQAATRSVRRATAFSPDGRRVAFVFDSVGIVSLQWNRVEPIAVGRDAVRSAVLAWSPDNKLLAFGSDKHVELWDVTKAPSRVRAHTVKGAASSLRFNAASRTLAAGLLAKEFLVEWDTASGAVKRQLTRPRAPLTVELSPDAAQVALIGDGLEVWDTQTDKLVMRVAGPEWADAPADPPWPRPGILFVAGAGAVAWDCGETVCVADTPDDNGAAKRRPLIGEAHANLWARVWSERRNARVDVDDRERAFVWDIAQARLHIVQLDLGCEKYRDRLLHLRRRSPDPDMPEPISYDDPRAAVRVVDMAPDASQFIVTGCNKKKSTVALPALANSLTYPEVPLKEYVLRDSAAGLVLQDGVFEIVGPAAGAAELNRHVDCQSSRPGPLGLAPLPRELCADWYRVSGLFRPF